MDGEQIQRSGSLSPSQDAAAGDDRVQPDSLRTRLEAFRESLRPGAGYDVFGGGRRNTGNERLPPMLRWPRGKLDKRHTSPKPAAPKMVGLPTRDAAPARSAPLAADAGPAERECASGVALALPRTRSQDAPPMMVRTGSDRSDRADALVRDRPPVRFTRRAVSDLNGGNGPSPDPPLVRAGLQARHMQAGKRREPWLSRLGQLRAERWSSDDLSARAGSALGDRPVYERLRPTAQPQPTRRHSAFGLGLGATQ